MPETENWNIQESQFGVQLNLFSLAKGIPEYLSIPPNFI
jgi:hypothetical protein